jgi:hypothetical protein
MDDFFMRTAYACCPDPSGAVLETIPDYHMFHVKQKKTPSQIALLGALLNAV